MKVLVAIKPVPNPDEKVKIKGDGSGIVLDNIKMVINPFCEIAVEEALRIKEKQGGEETGWHALATEWGVDGIPTMFLIDRNGVLRSTKARRDMEELIPKLLEEKGPEKK